MSPEERIEPQRLCHDQDPRPTGPTLLDLAAIIVGYGLAALAVRTLWPAGVTPRGPAVIALLLAYGWLGLAMSGPFVLLRRSGHRASDSLADRRGPPGVRVGQPLPPIEPGPSPRYTRAETAWLLIGAYWVLAAVLVLPTQLPPSSAPVLGLLPIGVALLLWILGPRVVEQGDSNGRWTHRAAWLVLATWPLAWLDIILLTATFG